MIAAGQTITISSRYEKNHAESWNLGRPKAFTILRLVNIQNIKKWQQQGIHYSLFSTHYTDVGEFCFEY